MSLNFFDILICKKAQDLTDKYVKEVESVSAVKQKEILEM